MSFLHWSRVLVSPKLSSKLWLAAGVGGSLFSLVPLASASVLVEPRIRQGVPQESVDQQILEQQTESLTPRRSSTSAQASDNIVEVANSTAGFSTLTSAITVANIGSVLSDEGPLTVFAPTDAAFEALPAGTLDSLLLPSNRDLLVKLLYNHVSYGDISSEQLISGQTGGQINTFDGIVAVDVMPNGVQVGPATVIQADVDASNGVIHAVDQVLLPIGFVEQLQARGSGVESPAPSSSTPSAVARPSVSQPPSVTQSAPAVTPAVSEVSADNAVNSSTPTAQTVEPSTEPSTVTGEAAPVRALW